MPNRRRKEGKNRQIAPVFALRGEEEEEEGSWFWFFSEREVCWVGSVGRMGKRGEERGT